jgi:hypothetical protein
MEKILHRLKVILILASVMIYASTACSTTRKTKKKCRDCPEFSLSEPNPQTTATLNGEI